MKKNMFLILIATISASLYGAAEPQTPHLNELPDLAIQEIGHFADDTSAVHLAQTSRRLAQILKPDLDERAKLLRYWKPPYKKICEEPGMHAAAKPIISPDGKIIAIQNEAGFTLGSRKTKKFIDKVFDPNEDTLALSFLKTDPKRILLKEIGEKHARTWEITKKANEETYDAKVIENCEMPDFDGKVVAVSPDGTTIASGRSQLLRIWKNGLLGSEYEVAGQPEVVTALAFSADSKHLAIGTTRGTVSILNLEKYEKVEMETHNSADNHAQVSSVVFSDDQNYLAASFTRNGFMCGGFMMWNLMTNDIIVNYTLNDVVALSISPDNRIIAAGLENRSLSFINIVKKCEFTIPYVHSGDGGTKYPAFSPDGKRVAIISSFGNFGLWRPKKPFLSKQPSQQPRKRARIDNSHP